LNWLYWHPSYMLNSHPLFVHFPVALWTAPIIFVVVSLIFRKPFGWNSAPALYAAAIATLVLGVVIGVITVLAGEHAAWTAPHPDAAHELLDDHETAALTSLGLAAVLSIWRLALWQRLRKIQLVFPIGLLALAGLITWTGHLGGQLVYRYGMGTTALKMPVEWSHEYEVTHGEQAGHPGQPAKPD